MDLHMWMPDVNQMRQELTRVGFQELRTPEEVEQALPGARGVTVVFVNSVCGCAGGVARPAAAMALAQGLKADHLYTVFAGQDKEATAKARTYFEPYPPSSPSIAILKDGKIHSMIERSQIEGNIPQAVASKLVEAVNQARGE